MLKALFRKQEDGYTIGYMSSDIVRKPAARKILRGEKLLFKKIARENTVGYHQDTNGLSS